jgi:hypothetical protein
VAKRIEVQIVGDASNLQRALSSATSGTSKFGSALAGLAKYGALAAGAAGVGGLALVLRQGVKELNQAEDATAQTTAGIKSTGAAANVTAKQVIGLAEAMMRKTGIDDEVIQSGENVLLTFTKIRNEVGKGNDIFNQATEAAANLHARMGIELPQAALQLGKALNDPARGMMRLQRIGVAFTDEQKNMVKQLMATGDTLGAQKVILAELTSEFGGSAVAAGKTFTGQLRILREEFNNFAGDLVAKAVPAMQRFLDFLQTVFKAQGFKAKLNVVWEGLESVASELGKKIATAIGGVDWTDVGASIAKAVKGAIDKSEEPVNEAGKSMLEKINKAIEGGNWDEVGQTLAQGLRDALQGGMKEGDSEAHKFVERLRDTLSHVPGLGVLMQIPTSTLAVSFVAALKTANAFYLDMLEASRTVWDQIKIHALQGVSSLAGILAKIPGPFQDNFKRAKQAAEQEIAQIKLDSMIRRINDSASEVTPGGKKAGEAYKRGFADSNIDPFVTGKLKEALSNASTAALGPARSGGSGIGNALGMGMAAGVSATTVALVGATTAAVHAAIFAGSKAARAGSPSKETEEKIGVPMGEGVIVGWIKSSAALPEKMAAKIKEAIEHARKAIEGARERLGSAFDGITDRILRAFDAQTGAHETATEQLLREQDERREMEDLIQAQTNAQIALNEAIATGDQAAIDAAQRALARATEDVGRPALEKVAEKERLEQNAIDGERRIALENRLVALEKHLAKEGASYGKAQKAILKLMAAFDIDYEQAGAQLGAAFVKGFQKAVGAVATAASAVNTAVPGASSFNPGPSAAGAGGITVNISAPIGSEQDLQNMVVSALAKVNGRGGIS